MNKLLFFFVFMVFSLIAYANQNDFSENEKFEMANKSYANLRTIQYSSENAVAELFQSRQFDKLERLFVDAENKSKTNSNYETQLIRSFEVFARLDQEIPPEVLKVFDSWISQKKSYVSHTAKGYYLAGAAARLRGGEYANKVLPGIMMMVNGFKSDATKEFDSALKIRPDYLPALWLLIQTNSTSGDFDSAEVTFHKAISLYPYSYALRIGYLQFLQPKWGGSIERANRIIEEAQKYGEKNPLLWGLRSVPHSLIGENYSLQAYEEHSKTKYLEAIQSYDKALQYIEKPSDLCDQAYDYYQLGDYKNSIKKVSRIARLVIHPDSKKNSKELLNILKTEQKRFDEKTEFPLIHSLESKQILGWTDFCQNWK